MGSTLLGPAHKRKGSNSFADPYTLNDILVTADETRPVEISPNKRYLRYCTLLGRGACKRVFKAFDIIDGVEVAWNQVEMIGLDMEHEARERLFGEIHTLQALRHRNIMSFHDWWYLPHTQTINFITEVFTSGTLRQYRKRMRTHISEGVITRWAWQVLQGLVYLHAHDPPIVHRDLKCDNIFINGTTGQVKIGDLGLATAQQGLSVVGTPEFMAPEIYEECYDEKVDIYSFGMCLLELATLEYPYSECHGVAQIYRKVTTGVKPQALQRVSSPQLREVIELCISHDPAERPTARQLVKHPFFEAVRMESSLGGPLGHSSALYSSGQYQNILHHSSTAPLLSDAGHVPASSSSSGPAPATMASPCRSGAGFTCGRLTASAVPAIHTAGAAACGAPHLQLSAMPEDCPAHLRPFSQPPPLPAVIEQPVLPPCMLATATAADAALASSDSMRSADTPLSTGGQPDRKRARGGSPGATAFVPGSRALCRVCSHPITDLRLDEEPDTWDEATSSSAQHKEPQPQQQGARLLPGGASAPASVSMEVCAALAAKQAAGLARTASNGSSGTRIGTQAQEDAVPMQQPQEKQPQLEPAHAQPQPEDMACCSAPSLVPRISSGCSEGLMACSPMTLLPPMAQPPPWQVAAPAGSPHVSQVTQLTASAHASSSPLCGPHSNAGQQPAGPPPLPPVVQQLSALRGGLPGRSAYSTAAGSACDPSLRGSRDGAGSVASLASRMAFKPHQADRLHFLAQRLMQGRALVEPGASPASITLGSLSTTAIHMLAYPTSPHSSAGIAPLQPGAGGPMSGPAAPGSAPGYVTSPTPARRHTDGAGRLGRPTAVDSDDDSDLSGDEYCLGDDDGSESDASSVEVIVPLEAIQQEAAAQHQAEAAGLVGPSHHPYVRSSGSHTGGGGNSVSLSAASSARLGGILAGMHLPPFMPPLPEAGAAAVPAPGSGAMGGAHVLSRNSSGKSRTSYTGRPSMAGVASFAAAPQAGPRSSIEGRPSPFCSINTVLSASQRLRMQALQEEEQPDCSHGPAATAAAAGRQGPQALLLPTGSVDGAATPPAVATPAADAPAQPHQGRQGSAGQLLGTEDCPTPPPTAMLGSGSLRAAMADARAYLAAAAAQPAQVPGEPPAAPPTTPSAPHHPQLQHPAVRRVNRFSLCPSSPSAPVSENGVAPRPARLLLPANASATHSRSASRPGILDEWNPAPPSSPVQPDGLPGVSGTGAGPNPQAAAVGSSTGMPPVPHPMLRPAALALPPGTMRHHSAISTSLVGRGRAWSTAAGSGLHSRASLGAPWAGTPDTQASASSLAARDSQGGDSSGWECEQHAPRGSGPSLLGGPRLPSVRPLARAGMLASLGSCAPQPSDELLDMGKPIAGIIVRVRRKRHQPVYRPAGEPVTQAPHRERGEREAVRDREGQASERHAMRSVAMLGLPRSYSL